MESKTGSESPNHGEIGEDVGSKTNANAPDLRLDKHGLPLSPQPSARKNDPLVNYPSPNQAQPVSNFSQNWHPALKSAVCLQVSLLALLGPNGSRIAEPGLCPARPRIRHNSRPGVVPAGGIPRVLWRGAAVRRTLCELDRSPAHRGGIFASHCGNQHHCGLLLHLGWHRGHEGGQRVCRRRHRCTGTGSHLRYVLSPRAGFLHGHFCVVPK